MFQLASRRDKVLALVLVVVAHGTAAWLLVANSSDTATPTGNSEAIVSVELFDARPPTPSRQLASMSSAPSPESSLYTPTRVAHISAPTVLPDVVESLSIQPVPQTQTVPPQPQTSAATGETGSSRASASGDTRAGHLSTTAEASAGGTPAPDAADRYPAQVLAWIERHKRYPSRASDRRLEGEAVVALTLDRRGRLRRVELVQSSGHALLDEAAIDAVRRADPFPRPETGNWTRRRFEVPLRFRPAQP